MKARSECGRMSGQAKAIDVNLSDVLGVIGFLVALGVHGVIAKTTTGTGLVVVPEAQVFNGNKLA